jgi:PAS domain S-box-containing protein/putative nucleotidyltransferase with HDIG domain
VHVVDRDLRIVLFNETFKQWSKKLGLKTDVIGKKLFDIFKFLPKRVQDEYTQVFNTGEMLVTVETTRFGDRDITTETRKIPIIEDDKVYRIITCIRDVTARKQALEALNKTEQEKAIILDSITEHVAYCDTNMSILWANRSVAEAFGVSPEQLIGRHCYDVGFNRKSPCEGCPIIETIKTGQSQVGEMTTAAGRIWYLRGYPVRNSVGNIEGVVQVSTDITELKKTEEALRESQLRYKALFDRGLLSVYVHDFDGQFIDANDTALNLLGYAREEIPSLNLNSLLSEDQIPKAHETMKELKCYGQQSRLTEYRLKRKDGQHIWVETEATLLYRGGKPYAVQGIARDITERKKAMEALEENEEKYRTLVEQSLQGIVIVQDFHVIFANKAFADISGFSVEELLSLPPEKVRALVHPEDQSLVWGRYMARLGGEPTPPHYEYRGIRKDGTVCWLEMLANVITYQQKPAVQAIIRDITAKKEAEEALQKSEKKYKALTDNINVGIYRNTVGPVGKFIEANPSIIKMFGYDSKEEFLSVNVADLYQHPEDRQKFNGKMLEYGFVKDEELQLRKKDGTPFFCSVSAVAVKDEHGRVQFYDGIIEDITERKRTQEQLHESLERLQKITENTLEAMAKILETRDPYTAGHQKRVAILVLAMADEMRLPEGQKGALHIASLIHDIGKIYVPAEILSRPTKLTQSEFALIKTHPGLGSDILRKIEFPYPIADIILQHHERVNGSGYPQGLKGDEIMYEARILCVADVVEAMSSHRPYRPARGIYATLDEITKNKGVLYDAGIVDICLKLFYEKDFKFDEDQVI